MSPSVLIVDDEATLTKNIQVFLNRNGFATLIADSGEQALFEVERFQPEVVLLDYKLGGMDGLEVLRQMRAKDSQLRIVLMTGQGSVKLAVEAMKAGAYDYLSKPLILEELKLLLHKIAEQNRLADTLAYYQAKEAGRSGLQKLLGESRPMLQLKQKLQRFLEAEQHLQGETPPAVLITGETGTGKELVARALHFDGQRREQPFIELNCAALPVQLMEAELFGYERGAFTDAKTRKPGLVEAAQHGTLLLDEIGEMDLALQAKLLRLLENKMVRRLGSLRDQTVDVRIIAATNQQLDQRVQQGEFRADLLFRLRIIHLELPPLRERGDDILLLTEHFLKLLCRRYGKDLLSLDAAAKDLLQHYTWPGNVRELRNMIEQAVLLADGPSISSSQLAIQQTPAADAGAKHETLTELLEKQQPKLADLELIAITQALEQNAWNLTHAAKQLDISRDALRYRMEKHGLRKN